MSQLTSDGRNQLFGMLNAYFDSEELKTLCFGLGIDWDNLPGETKQAKVRELILRCERTNGLDALRTECERQRPTVDWAASFRVDDGAHKLLPSVPSHRTSRPLIVIVLAVLGLVTSLAIYRMLAQTSSGFTPSSPSPTSLAQGDASGTFVPTTTIDCPIKWFFQTDARPVDGLCPESASSNRGINQQDFQRGRMMSFTGDASVWVIIGTNNRAWEWLPYDDTWVPGQPEPEPSQQPPSGLHVPKERFGKVWHEQELVNTLGWATGGARAYSGVRQQSDQGVWFFRGEQGILYRCTGSGGGGICEIYESVPS